MVIFNLARRHADAIRRIGVVAREDACVAGTAIVYIDRTGRMVREWPREGRVEVLCDPAQGDEPYDKVRTR